MREIPEQLLGTKFMTGADRDQPKISVLIYEFLSDDLQYSLYFIAPPFQL